MNGLTPESVSFQEAERKEREERERRENEEYLKLKESFAVEDEGFEGREEDNDRNLLQDFVNYIKVSHIQDIFFRG